jgi:RNA polymerase sigma-70 factor (ECF subfamily)
MSPVSDRTVFGIASRLFLHGYFFVSVRRPSESNTVDMARTDDDEILLGRFKRGDEAAFDEIVLRFQHEVAALVSRLLAWSGDVDDVVQEVFLAVYLNLRRFRGDSSLKSWIFTITVNKCRSKKRKRWLVTRDSNRAISENAVAAADGLTQEAHQAVHQTVQRLPLKYREPIVLKYLQELPTDQICRILGISRNTLNVRLLRAREQLKQRLASWVDEL